MARDLPVKFVGVDELHAAFLNESRTRCSYLVPVREIRVKPFFGLSGTKRLLIAMPCQH
jgi:hypothetical protein